MPEQADRSQPERVTLAAASYGTAGVVSGALALLGYTNDQLGVLAMGLAGLVLVLATAPLSLLAMGRRDDASGTLAPELVRLRESVDRLSEQQALSDDARRVLNRSRERELLRRAIQEDIAAEDWDAALVLADELANRFGYRADAEEFRARVDRARAATLDRNVSAAIAALDALIVQRRWEHAAAHASSLQRLYPDSQRVLALRQRVEQARDRYKNDLERRFLHAAQEDRNDEALELLRELDAYLTEAEAEPFRELARGVIGKARENLGAGFKIAIRDRRWKDAAHIGERIIAEFPNSRMAEEVRSMIDGVRARAASPVPAG